MHKHLSMILLLSLWINQFIGYPEINSIQPGCIRIPKVGFPEPVQHVSQKS